MKHLVSSKKVERGWLYKTDGTVVTVCPGDGKAFTHYEWAILLGGPAESLIPAQHTGVCQLYANEEGRLRDLPPNPHTRAVCNMAVYALNGYSHNWRVAGNILAIKKIDQAGALSNPDFKSVREAVLCASSTL